MNLQQWKLPVGLLSLGLLAATRLPATDTPTLAWVAIALSLHLAAIIVAAMRPDAAKLPAILGLSTIAALTSPESPNALGAGIPDAVVAFLAIVYLYRVAHRPDHTAPRRGPHPAHPKWLSTRKLLPFEILMALLAAFPILATQLPARWGKIHELSGPLGPIAGTLLLAALVLFAAWIRHTARREPDNDSTPATVPIPKEAAPQ